MQQSTETHAYTIRRLKKDSLSLSLFLSIISHRKIVAIKSLFSMWMYSLHLGMHDGEILSTMSSAIGPDACIYVILCNRPREYQLSRRNYTSFFCFLLCPTARSICLTQRTNPSFADFFLGVPEISLERNRQTDRHAKKNRKHLRC